MILHLVKDTYPERIPDRRESRRVEHYERSVRVPIVARTFQRPSVNKQERTAKFASPRWWPLWRTACQNEHAFPSLILEILTCRGEQDQRAQYARVTHHRVPVTLCRRVFFRNKRVPNARHIHDAPNVHCTHLTSFIGRICGTVSRSPSFASSPRQLSPSNGTQRTRALDWKGDWTLCRKFQSRISNINSQCIFY